MNIDNIHLEESLKQINNLLKEANEIFDKGGIDEDAVPQMLVDFYIEDAFIQTMVLLDRLELSRTYKQFYKIYIKAKKEGFTKSGPGIEEPYLVWSGEIYTYLVAIGNSYNVYPFSEIVSADLASILRSTVYSINDKNVFKTPPANEREVHYRIEAVLRCIFPNLKHKPSISKPIKNFEPDTGLPSVQTLVEYKFISNQNEAKRVSDEILADTRGYFSTDWKKFIYVIYETSRVKLESEWNNMLIECGVPSDTRIIVLSGEPISS